VASGLNRIKAVLLATGPAEFDAGDLRSHTRRWWAPMAVSSGFLGDRAGGEFSVDAAAAGEKQQAGAPHGARRSRSHWFWIIQILEAGSGGGRCCWPRNPATFAAASHHHIGRFAANQALHRPPDRAGQGSRRAGFVSRHGRNSLASKGPGDGHSRHCPMTGHKDAFVLLDSSRRGQASLVAPGRLSTGPHKAGGFSIDRPP